MIAIKAIKGQQQIIDALKKTNKYTWKPDGRIPLIKSKRGLKIEARKKESLPGINYSNPVVITIKAIQEQQQVIDIQNNGSKFKTKNQ